MIQGDFIGLDATGSVAFANSENGILALVSGDTIGGTSPAARNVISGNGIAGISESSGVTVEGNFVGTNAAGTAGVPNGVGVRCYENSTTLGGTAAGAGNVISGNSGDGVELGGSFDMLQGNLIGTDPSGTRPLGNGGDGVAIPDVINQVEAGFSPGPQTFGDSIGGTAAGAGNVIADNLGDGVSIRVSYDDLVTYTLGPIPGGMTTTHVGYQQNPASGQSDRVSGDAIFGNGGLGIHLFDAADSFTRPAGSTEPVLPPPAGAPPGANDLLAAPTLGSAIFLGNSATIAGTVAAGPSEVLTVELFGDPAGEGQGQVYLGSVAVATDAAGRGSFTFSSPTPMAARFVTATATDPSGNTSQFSTDAPAVVIQSSTVVLLGPNRVATQGQPITFTAAVASTAAGSPTGSVEFLEDGVVIGSSPLAADGLAAFVTDQFLPGPHVITAMFLGGGSLPASGISNAVAVEVTNVTAFGGPAVTSDVLVGPRLVQVTFNRGLLMGPAEDVANYKIMGPRHQVITIESAVYDPSNASVTLTTAQALDPKKTYQLTINGQKGDRIVDVFGIALNGKAKGKPGHNYSGKIEVKKAPVVKVAHPSTSRPRVVKAAAHPKGR